MSSRSWQERYLHRFYDSRPGWIDGTTEFHNLCADVIPRGGRILELGAGPSNRTSRFMAELGELHGIDPDPDVADNDALASAEVMTTDAFPYAPASFDACVSNYVVEHVVDPRLHLQQIRSVLKPGAPYVFRTPNKRHYAYAVAALTPHSFHRALAIRLRNFPEEAHEPYPTVYAMNTVNKIRSLAQSANFSVDVVRVVEKEPLYGLASRALFLPFMAYERVVNTTDRFAGLRSTILAVLRSP
jgi:SAM-dependent methyltransferase